MQTDNLIVTKSNLERPARGALECKYKYRLLISKRNVNAAGIRANSKKTGADRTPRNEGTQMGKLGDISLMCFVCTANAGPIKGEAESRLQTGWNAFLDWRIEQEGSWVKQGAGKRWREAVGGGQSELLGLGLDLGGFGAVVPGGGGAVVDGARAAVAHAERRPREAHALALTGGGVGRLGVGGLRGDGGAEGLGWLPLAEDGADGDGGEGGGGGVDGAGGGGGGLEDGLEGEPVRVERPRGALGRRRGLGLAGGGEAEVGRREVGAEAAAPRGRARPPAPQLQSLVRHWQGTAPAKVRLHRPQGRLRHLKRPSSKLDVKDGAGKWGTSVGLVA